MKAKPAPPPPEAQAAEPVPSEASADPVASQPSALAAAGEIEGDPVKAHRDLAALIQAHPQNAHLRALDLVALAKSGDGAGFLSAWDAAREAGVQPEALRLTPRFNTLLREQKRNPTLPAAALQSLQEAYGGQQQRRWTRRNR
jgi:hypothetical protein